MSVQHSCRRIDSSRVKFKTDEFLKSAPVAAIGLLLHECFRSEVPPNEDVRARNKRIDQDLRRTAEAMAILTGASKKRLLERPSVAHLRAWETETFTSDESLRRSAREVLKNNDPENIETIKRNEDGESTRVKKLLRQYHQYGSHYDNLPPIDERLFGAVTILTAAIRSMIDEPPNAPQLRRARSKGTNRSKNDPHN